MNAATIQSIETSVEGGAAALFGGAVTFAAVTALRGALPPLQLSACGGAVAVAAFLLCRRAMALAAGRGRQLPVPIFDVRELEPFESDELLAEGDSVAGELLLTDADRLVDELVLTDADRLQPAELAVQAADSRVVRLFDRHAMPNPGELKSRVDNHLAQARAPQSPSDASQALAAALAELRRSLR